MLLLLLFGADFRAFRDKIKHFCGVKRKGVWPIVERSCAHYYHCYCSPFLCAGILTVAKGSFYFIMLMLSNNIQNGGRGEGGEAVSRARRPMSRKIGDGLNKFNFKLFSTLLMRCHNSVVMCEAICNRKARRCCRSVPERGCRRTKRN